MVADRKKPHLTKPFEYLLLFLRALCLLSVIYGFYSQNTNPHFSYLNSKRYGGTFEYLTMLAAILTIFTMTFGLVSFFVGRMHRHHMHMVSIVMPIELIVTGASWIMWFFFREGIHSPDAVAIGYVEFDLVNHICLHLMPFIGLMLDFVSELDNFKFHPLQGLMILVASVAYLSWMLFLYQKNKKWVYHVISTLSTAQFYAFSAAASLTALSFWGIEGAIASYVLRKNCKQCNQIDEEGSMYMGEKNDDCQ